MNRSDADEPNQEGRGNLPLLTPPRHDTVQAPRIRGSVTRTTSMEGSGDEQVHGGDDNAIVDSAQQARPSHPPGLLQSTAGLDPATEERLQPGTKGGGGARGAPGAGGGEDYDPSSPMKKPSAPQKLGSDPLSLQSDTRWTRRREGQEKQSPHTATEQLREEPLTPSPRQPATAAAVVEELALFMLPPLATTTATSAVTAAPPASLMRPAGSGEPERIASRASEAQPSHDTREEQLRVESELQTMPPPPSPQGGEQKVGAPDSRQAEKFMERLPLADFYRNPTLLSRLILNQKYQVAMSRLKRHPEEARVVIVARRRMVPPSLSISSSAPAPVVGEVTTYLRQLPIHLACVGLGHAVDPALREVLNQLITHLVVTFPEACACADHSGTYPIQYAVRNGAQASTVSLLLMAVPESLLYSTSATPTRPARSLSQLNYASGSPHRKQVAQVLKLDLDFWRQSREEANFRLQEQQRHQLQRQLGPNALNPHRQVHSESAIEPLRNESVTPMAWDQLEIRAIGLEQILSEMNERNYTLNRKIESLAKTKMDLLDHLDRIKQSALAKEARRLQHQNRALQKQIGEMEQLLRHAGERQRDDEEKQEITPLHATSPSGTPPPRHRRVGSESSSLVGHSPTSSRHPRQGSESSSLVGHSPWSGERTESSVSVSTRGIQTKSLQADNLRLIQENHELRHKYQLLNGAYRSQQTRLNRLISLIRRLSRDAAALLLEAGVESHRGDGTDSRRSLSESPLTNSEESSVLSEAAGRRVPPPSEGRRSGSLPERQQSKSGYPRRQRTIEIQWHSVSTGLAPSPSSFRGRISPDARGEGEEKVDDDHENDAVYELSDNLSVLFAQAIEHEDESLPFLPAAPTAPVLYRRRLSAEDISAQEQQRRSTSENPEPPSTVLAFPPPQLSSPRPDSPPSSSRRRRRQQSVAATNIVDDLQIPALLADATEGEMRRAGGTASSSTPPVSL